MKFYILLTTLIAAFGSVHCAEAQAETQVVSQINWTTNFDAAKKQAQAESKPMFVYFTGSDWCPWCIKMDSQILSTPEFQQALAQKMIFVKVDFPRKSPQDQATKDQNQKLSNEFGIQGFPSVIILDSKGQKIEKMGFQSGGGANYAKKVQDVLDAYNKK